MVTCEGGLVPSYLTRAVLMRLQAGAGAEGRPAS